MKTSSRGVFTPTRIVALGLIAVLAGILAYLRFAPGEERVSVPTGAKAGDLFLDSCSYSTANGSYEADCGTLVVPENRNNPQSRLIALPVTRIRARSENPGEPIFRLEGGPGITNMKFKNASRFVENRDVVLVGYRGVDGSIRLDCPEVDSALRRSTDLLGDKHFEAYGNAFRACADRLTREGIDVASYGLVQQVDDLELARKALGYDRVDLLSESAGTRTAMIYAWRYPQSIHRSVMIGVNPPGHFLWDAPTIEEQIGRYAELCSRDASCSKRTDDLAALVRRMSADMPDRWLFLPIRESNVLVYSFFGLMESTSAQWPLSAPVTLDSLLAADEGDASGLWLASSFVSFFPIPFVWGQYAAAGSIDAQAARQYFSSLAQGDDANLSYAGSAWAWGGGRLVDDWPVARDTEDYRRVQPSGVEALLISGALDTSTPPQAATRELLPHLPNGRQVVLPAFGHTVSFWSDQPEAGTRLINVFLDSGRVDDSLYRPQSVDFSPGRTFPTLAKVIAGAMIGLALLTLVSLLWMVRRVHKSGSLGRRTSVVVRSAYPVVLGLGGWSFAALAVLTTSAPVPVGTQSLVVLSVGAPIGLGVFWAWVHGEWPRRARVMGFAAAATGAFLGAWLGHNATDGPMAILTLIGGATGGANLLLIALEVTSELSNRRRAAAVTLPPASTRAAV